MRILLLALPALAALSACATPAGGPTGSVPPVTPTERYALTTAPGVDEIALAPRAEGLSPAQREALAALTARFRAERAPAVLIQVAQGLPEGHDAARTAAAARAELEGLGVQPAEIRTAAFDAAGQRPVVRIGFETVQAVVPQCGREWTNLTATKDNAGFTNFGCAVTANMAAQIADPRDIQGRRAMDPADAGRRQVVLGKYRLGESTASKADDAGRGVVSNVVE
jgi:pilus assembly protein CpaD